MLRILFIVLINTGMFAPALAAEFDHSLWDSLLKQHVHATPDGLSTAVQYGELAARRDRLTRYLDSLSQVKRADFDNYSKYGQLAFLINAYNAWTVDLILSRYPGLESIKDIGGLFSSPWKQTFIPLFGQKVSLDDIEHGMIRGSDRYREPRIHFAVNCASIGCPALRAEAYQADKLDEQLEEQTRYFLADTTRNRVANDMLEVSSIFKWYRDDFQNGWRGAAGLPEFFALYADSLKMPHSLRQRAESGKLNIRFLDYDWRLNEAK